MQKIPCENKGGSKNCYGPPLSKRVFSIRRANEKACFSPHHAPPVLVTRKCLYGVLPISLASKLLFQDALGELGTNATCMALAQPAIRHCEKYIGTKRIQALFHSTAEAVPTCWLQTIPDLLSVDLTIHIIRQN